MSFRAYSLVTLPRKYVYLNRANESSKCFLPMFRIITVDVIPLFQVGFMWVPGVRWESNFISFQPKVSWIISSVPISCTSSMHYPILGEVSFWVVSYLPLINLSRPGPVPYGINQHSFAVWLILGKASPLSLFFWFYLLLKLSYLFMPLLFIVNFRNGWPNAFRIFTGIALIS